MKQIKISLEATQDLIEGYKFYEKQEEGVGTYFLDSLYSDIASLSIYSGVHQIYFEKYYRQLSMRFPFAIYYTFNENFIYVQAILDCRRESSWSTKRLS